MKADSRHGIILELRGESVRHQCRRRQSQNQNYLSKGPRKKRTMETFPNFHIPSTVETPSICIDFNRMEQNIHRMASGLAANGVTFRPHVKSHKSLNVARQQIEAGAIGLTAATIGEAEVFVEGGFDNVFIAYPLWLTDAKAA